MHEIHGLTKVHLVYYYIDGRKLFNSFNSTVLKEHLAMMCYLICVAVTFKYTKIGSLQHDFRNSNKQR